MAVSDYLLKRIWQPVGREKERKENWLLNTHLFFVSRHTHMFCWKKVFVSRRHLTILLRYNQYTALTVSCFMITTAVAFLHRIRVKSYWLAKTRSYSNERWCTCWSHHFRSSRIASMDPLSSLKSLQQQTAYALNVDICQGELLVGGSTKNIYRSAWLKGAGDPIVLLEIKGDAARQEAMLCLTLDHPHIVHTYGLVKPAASTQAHDTLLLLQEYAADGDLGSMLERRIFIPSESVLNEIFIQIASAMTYLSQNKTVHGDLACRNVLVFQSHPDDPKKNCVKLIDFGLTRNDLNLFRTAPMIPVRYAATEILRSQGRSGYSERSDVYSFAVLMWEACCRTGGNSFRSHQWQRRSVAKKDRWREISTTE